MSRVAGTLGPDAGSIFWASREDGVSGGGEAAWAIRVAAPLGLVW